MFCYLETFQSFVSWSFYASLRETRTARSLGLFFLLRQNHSEPLCLMSCVLRGFLVLHSWAGTIVPGLFWAPGVISLNPFGSVSSQACSETTLVMRCRTQGSALLSSLLSGTLAHAKFLSLPVLPPPLKDATRLSLASSPDSANWKLPPDSKLGNFRLFLFVSHFSGIAWYSTSL